MNGETPTDLSCHPGVAAHLDHLAEDIRQLLARCRIAQQVKQQLNLPSNVLAKQEILDLVLCC